MTGTSLPSRRLFGVVFRIASLAALLVALLGSVVTAQPLPTAKAAAPDNHVLLKRTAGGGYFIAKPLKEEYDRLLGRLRLLKGEIDAGRTTGAEALRELKDLQAALDAFRKEIEDKMVMVSIAKTHTATETITFDLGTERCLLIESDNVRVVGWDQLGVKCELEKTVLTADDNLDEADVAGIKLVHRQGRFPEKVGRTRAESEAFEREFLSSDAGKALSAEALESRKKRLEGIRASWDHMRDFQDKEIDLVETEGLTHQQGNRQIMLEFSYAGGKSVGSEWRRHARLTVYLPTCQHVALRTGGATSLVSMDVDHVKSSVVLWSGGTPISGHSGAFQVRGVEGSVTIQNVPLNLIEDVSGNLTIMATADLSGRSARSGRDGRTLFNEPPLACSCKNISGDLVAWFAREDVQLEKIGGRIDVRNEFGNTKIQVDQPLKNVAHRVVSEAGRVEVQVSRSALGDLPLLAATQSGTLRTNTQREFLEDFNMGTQDDEGALRKWVGLKSARGQANRFDAKEFLDRAARFGLILNGQDRSAGLDLISRVGAVVVEANP